jgi:AcrR family transcriptional regulator
MSSSGAPTVCPASREIARAAVQAELSLAAYELVVEKGYGNVTLDDMAAAGGVSRSTFLRYFRTKDQAILVALKAYVERKADALRARPREEDAGGGSCIGPSVTMSYRAGLHLASKPSRDMAPVVSQ